MGRMKEEKKEGEASGPLHVPGLRTAGQGDNRLGLAHGEGGGSVRTVWALKRSLNWTCAVGYLRPEEIAQWALGPQ